MTRKHGLVIIENPLIPFKGYKLINLCGLIFCRRGVADAITETDANHERIHTEQQKDMAQWCNKRMIFTTCEFEDFSPRKGFTCKKYFEDDTLRL